MFKAVVMRDMKAAWSGGGSAANGLAFFGMSYALLAMALGAERASEVSHALLAVALLLTLMLSLPALFDSDMHDGTLEQYLIMPITKSWLMLAKLAAYWLAHMLPVLVVAGLISLLTAKTEMPMQEVELLRLLLMSLWLTALGGIAAVISLLHGKGLFARALVVLPLYVPALIAATLGESSLLLICLQLAVALVLVPVAAFIGGALLASAVE